MAQTATIDPDRLAKVTALSRGSHSPTDGEMCAMEMVSWIAGEKWSDHPACASQVIGAFLRNWNDCLPNDERNALILPFIPRLVGTKGSAALENRRATMAADWLIRTHTPAWLRLAGLNDEAEALSSLPEITDFAQTPSIMGPLKAAQKNAAAAWAAAWDAAGAAAGAAARDAARAAAWAAAWDAARAAARAAAWDAARAAARAAAWAAAWDAAGAAARDAAGAAAWDALKQAKTDLQASAADLVDRMIRAQEAA